MDLNTSLWSNIARQLTAATAQSFDPVERCPVSGGCINACYVIGDGSRRYFLKLNRAEREAMFQAEAEGLAKLDQAGAVRVPRPVCHGVAEGHAFIVLEYLALGRAKATAAERLGRELAQLHKTTTNQFGWRMDNTIGSTPQINTPMDDWVEFFRRHRLQYQLQLAATHGHTGNLQRKGERLAAGLEVFFAGHHPQPSLLHGDLWSGNYAVDAQEAPVIFDPAVYYGDREADVAMTELFGGFQAAFYAAYREAWPLDVGYGVRKTLYNLYHVLNHLNLFGSGYRAQAEQMIDRLLSEM